MNRPLIFAAVTLCTLTGLSAGPARADLAGASHDYRDQKFNEAFNEFHAIAELGQPTAQYNLAVMYSRGEGTTHSDTYAHAWASLAVKNGDPKAQALVDELAPQLTPTSLRISAEIQAQYSPEVLNARLMPSFLTDREYADREPLRAEKSTIPDVYPVRARREGIQGQVYLEFVVAPDGRVRLPRVLYAVPGEIFDSSAREALLHTTYVPARVNGKPVATLTSRMVRFTLQGVSNAEYTDLPSFMARTLHKAEAGDPQAQNLYAMAIAGLPQVHRPYSEALPWFLKAAQSGSRYAQYQIGTALLSGRGCRCEETKGEIWLERAAQADQADAQVTLAEHLLAGKPRAEAAAGARLWLERASKNGNKNAKLYLAALLATSADAGAGDAKTALQLVEQVFADLRDDPSTYEIRAAAHAANSDFGAAAKDERTAIDHAKAFGWDLAPLQARLDMYAARKPCTDNLLMF